MRSHILDISPNVDTGGLSVTCKCTITEDTNIMELDATIDEFQAWENGTLIQNAFPRLNPEEREFLLTGMMPETWDRLFGEN